MYFKEELVLLFCMCESDRSGTQGNGLVLRNWKYKIPVNGSKLSKNEINHEFSFWYAYFMIFIRHLVWLMNFHVKSEVREDITFRTLRVLMVFKPWDKKKQKRVRCQSLCLKNFNVNMTVSFVDWNLTRVIWEEESLFEMLSISDSFVSIAW